MSLAFGPENIPTIVAASTTSVTLAATNQGQNTRVSVGGLTYSPSSVLTLSTSSTGANGLDSGSLGASQTWYVYAISNQTTDALALIASQTAPSSGPAMPSGYGSAYRALGIFLTDTSSLVSTAYGINPGIPGTVPVNIGLDASGELSLVRAGLTSPTVELKIFSPNTGSAATALSVRNSSGTAANDGFKIVHGAGVTKFTDLGGTQSAQVDLTNGGLWTFASRVSCTGVQQGVGISGTANIAPALGRWGYLVIISSNFGTGSSVRSSVTHVVTNNEGTAVAFTGAVSTLNGQSATFSVSGGFLQVSGLSAGNNSVSVYY